MSAIFVYATFGDRQNAYDIASDLVERRLVSCANIFPPIESIYHWEDKVEQENEVVVIMKTRAELFENAKEFIVEHHSYECPCVVALPIERGHSPFMDWIEAETRIAAAEVSSDKEDA